MEPFPFSQVEWSTVEDAARAIVDAGAMEDAVLRASAVTLLIDRLETLRFDHGEHPVLLETEADFADGFDERLRLYRLALNLAESNHLPTLSIRLSLARLLLDARQPMPAKAELLACQCELAEADDADRTAWFELLTTADAE